jgi:kynurenine formamidase
MTGMTSTPEGEGQHGRIDLSADGFRALFRDVSNWGRWGDEGERGALNHLTAERVAAAAGLVRSGLTVTLSQPFNTEASIENPHPGVHRMTMLTDEDIGSGTVRFAKDYIGVDYHNDGHSHIDALCHVAFDGCFFDGEPDTSVTERGAEAETIEVLRSGLVGRGVLLDVPRVRGVPWMEPGEHVFTEDLEAAERDQGVRVGTGDILLVRTGHARRLAELPPWDTPNAKPGLHPTTASFLAERCVAALGSDGNSDTAPSTTEGIDFPIHVLAINAMGIHLLDYLQFEDLVRCCEDAGRWEFLFVCAPLRLARGTGSPVNPIAVF